MADATVAATDWHAALRAQAVARPAGASATVAVAAFNATPAEVVQPALAEDVLCLHRGGTKRVHRLRDGRRTVHEVEPNTLTLLQRGRSARWLTEGPIDYVHLPIDARRLDELAREDRGLSRAAIEFDDTVGFRHLLLAALVEELLRIARAGDECALYRESLIDSCLLALVHHANGERPDEPDQSPLRGGLTGRRLRVVLDYIQENSATDLSYGALVEASGVSRAHFFRAFRQSTGTTPGRYLERLRVERARAMIQSGQPLEDSAAQAGFASAATMARAFRRTIGVTPDVYRRCLT